MTHLRRVVSAVGGVYPRWSTDGKELFFVDGRSQLVAVPVSRQGENLKFGKPVALFKVLPSRGGSPYSVIDNGTFLTMSDPAAGQIRPITIVVNSKSTDTLFTMDRLKKQLSGALGNKQSLVFDGLNETRTAPCA